MLDSIINSENNNYFEICRKNNLKRITFNDFSNNDLTNIEVLLNYDLNSNEENKIEIFLSSLDDETKEANSDILQVCLKICIHYNKIKLFKIIEKYNTNIFKKDVSNFECFKKITDISGSRYYSKDTKYYNEFEPRKPNNYNTYYNIFSKTIMFKVLLGNYSNFLYILQKYNYDFNILIYLYSTDENILQFINYKFFKLLSNTKLSINYNIFSKYIFKKILNDVNKYNKIWRWKDENFFINLIFKTNDNNIYDQFLDCIIDTKCIYVLKKFLKEKPYYFKKEIGKRVADNFFNNCLISVKYENNPSKNICSIFDLISPYIINNIGKESYEDIINKYLNEIVCIKNIYKLFELFEKYELNINYNHVDIHNFPVIADCLKYGCINTLRYLLNNTSLVLPSYINVEQQIDLIDCSLYNYNYKVNQYLIDYYKLNNINYNYNYYNLGNYVGTMLNILNRFYYSNSNTKRKTYVSNLKKKIIQLKGLFDYCNIGTDDYFSILYGECLKNKLFNILDFIDKLGFNLTNLSFLTSYEAKYIFGNIDYFKKVYGKIKNDLMCDYYEPIYINNYVRYSSNNKNLNNIYHSIFDMNCICDIDKYLEYYKKLKFSNKYLYFADYYNPDLHYKFCNHIDKCKNCKYCSNNLEKSVIKSIKFFKEKLMNIHEKDEFFFDNNIILPYYNNQYYGSSDISKFCLKSLIIHGLNETDIEYYNINDKYYLIKKKEILDKLIKKRKNIIHESSVSNTSLFINNFMISKYFIKQYIKNRQVKNINKYKKQISSINNEFKYKPINSNHQDKSFINKIIGYEFKKNYYSTFSKNPMHIKPSHLLDDIHKTHIYITEKADGIKQTDFLSNISDIDSDLEIQYEVVDGVSIVFNISNSSNVYENMCFLRSYHKYAPTFKDHDFSKENLELYKKEEQNAFKKYLNENKNSNTKLWWPKFIWKIEKSHLDYIKSLVELKPCNIFKTDGYILYSRNIYEDTYKIKPFDLLTIDLKFIDNNWYSKEGTIFTKYIIDGNYENNKIYRIYYNSTLNVYEPKEIRQDKKNANNNNIIDFLVKSHETKWSIKDIYNNIKNINYYQTYNVKSKYLYNIIKRNRFRDFHFLKNNILDLGCGYNQNYIKHINENVNITCLDNDLKIINKCSYRNKNINYGLFDFTEKIQNQLKIFGNIKNMYFSKLEKKFDTILMINTIHNGFKNNNTINNLIDNLNLFSKKNTILVIRFLDFDKLNLMFNDNNIISDNCNYIRKVDENKLKIFFSWTHNNPIEEVTLTTAKLVNCFKNSWSLVYEEQNKNNYANIMENYFNCFKTIVFKKQI